MGKSVIELVDTLLHNAIAQSASDIHLEPTDQHLRIRSRIDGVLYDQKVIEHADMAQVLSRLKVLARMNIAEKRLPQDGKFGITVDNKPIDLRVSTFPTFFGEKMVVRILDRAAYAMSLGQLGFAPDMLETLVQLLHNPNGLLLVTGPTGSGKTTTLYAALSALHSSEKNIVTLEDPVEYNLEGITQGQINPDAGFTFEKGIRSVLRQDPDILMVGEIRDKQTARIAIEAALTGHVVLSTLHTNDAPSAIMRLMDMGIEPFLINASLIGVLAKRLVRKICTACKKNVEPTQEELAFCQKLGLSDTQLYAGAGCAACNGLGYKGRTGVFELLTVTSPLRSLIVNQPVFDAIYAQVRDDGMYTLLQDGVRKVQDGEIALCELARIVA